jgi:hypothetical protein
MHLTQLAKLAKPRKLALEKQIFLQIPEIHAFLAKPPTFSKSSVKT